MTNKLDTLIACLPDAPFKEQLTCEINLLREQVAVLRKALEDVEWQEYEDPDWGKSEFCAECRNDKKYGHYEDCYLNFALAATETKGAA